MSSAEMSGIAGSPTLTESVYGFSWSTYFPVDIAGGSASLRPSSFETIFSLLGQQRSGVRGEQENQYRSRVTVNEDARTRFMEISGDFFLIAAGEIPAGGVVGNLTDWETYYLRYFFVTQPFQGRNFHLSAVRKLMSVLRSVGVRRVDADVSPSHIPSLNAGLDLGFKPSGVTLSERWGALTRMTRLLSGEHEKVFREKFCQHPGRGAEEGGSHETEIRTSHSVMDISP